MLVSDWRRSPITEWLDLTNSGSAWAIIVSFIGSMFREEKFTSLRLATFNTGRLDHIYEDPHTDKKWLVLHYGDLADGSGLARLLGRIQPEEIYNLAAQSHVRVSFDCSEYTTDITATGVVRLLENESRRGCELRSGHALLR